MPGRFTGRCKACAGIVSIEATIEKKFVALPNGAREFVYYSESLGHHFGAMCLCGKRITFIRVRGRVTAHKCGAKCLSSKGHVCECSCGGKNHGAGFS